MFKRFQWLKHEAYLISNEFLIHYMAFSTVATLQWTFQVPNLWISQNLQRSSLWKALSFVSGAIAREWHLLAHIM